MVIECKWSAGEFDPDNLRFFRKNYPLGENLVVAFDVDRPFTREYKGLKVKMLGLRDLVQLLRQKGGEHPTTAKDCR